MNDVMANWTIGCTEGEGASCPLAPCTHLTDDQVVGYLMEDLFPEISSIVDKHLSQCDGCSRDMANLIEETRAWLARRSANWQRSTNRQIEAVFNKLNEEWEIISGFREGRMKDSDTQTADQGLSRRHRIVTFALHQKTLDSKRKDVVAEWAVENFRLSSGAGVFFDAGSSCLKAWEALRQQISQREIMHISVVTNNFMILMDWANKSFTKLQDTIVDMVGGSFDASHLALYGEGVRQRLMSGTFRPAVVYIGSSGIEFDDRGSMLFGYHANEPEREVKELLFQCPCKARVILATARKIGNAGGTVFDLLQVPNLDVKAPLYLVTTPPEPDTLEQELYERALRLYSSDRVQEAILEKGLNFKWIEIIDAHKAVNLTDQVVRGSRSQLIPNQASVPGSDPVSGS
jgi:DeoR/GlpR family transcriptional regulator of sugar metabolism